MSEEKKEDQGAPRISAGVMRLLCERLAARVDSAASMVEPGHLDIVPAIHQPAID